jgi:outer membrane protein assembly factor BamB
VRAPFALVPAWFTLIAACGGDPLPSRILRQWTYATPAAAAPPGVGPEDRVLGVLREAAPAGGGELVTIQAANGLKIEGPHPGAPLSDHAPIFAAGRVVVISKIGKLVAINLAGEIAYTEPPGNGLGLTSPLTLAADGTLRVGTTAGSLITFNPETGAEIGRAEAGGAISTAPAAAAGGVAYAATDLGRVIGADAQGAIVFDRSVTPPASGPSVADNGDLWVGAGDGVVVFGADGTEKGRRARAARVVGTLPLPGGDALAWGEDGLIERLGPDASLRWSAASALSSPPPIYARPVLVPDQAVGFIDSRGIAHLVDAAGTERATLELGAAPLPEATVSDLGALLVSAGGSIEAIGFVLGE